MVSACLAWPGLHIAFVEASKQPQMSSDSWHTVFWDSMPIHVGMPGSTGRASMELVFSEEIVNNGIQLYVQLPVVQPLGTQRRNGLCLGAPDTPGRKQAWTQFQLSSSISQVQGAQQK